jgi:uracil-DNA glycosylase
MQPAHIKIMFEGLTEVTKNLLAKKLSRLLSSTIVAVNADLVKANPADPLCVLTPKPELIFEAFRKCPVENIRVVIIGQDPYIKPGEAHGLSFSVPSGVVVPPSLRNIYKCLQHNKLIGAIPTSGNLTSWATQGVLLLNSALTTRLRTSNAHADIWSGYTDSVIKEISSATRPIIFVLLGGFAQEKRSLIDVRRHLVFEWGHPSNLNRVNTDENSPKNFKYCNIFNQINDHLSLHGGLPIDWDPTHSAPTMIPLGPREMSAPTLGVAFGTSVIRSSPYTTLVTLRENMEVEDICNDNNGSDGTCNDNNDNNTANAARPEPQSGTSVVKDMCGGMADGIFAMDTSKVSAPTKPAVTTPTVTTLKQPGEKIGLTSQNVPYVIREWCDQDPQCYTSDVLWVFTDGGSKGNGKAHCVAAYGWYVTDGEKISFSTGVVPAAEIAGVVYKASNNRGELMAILSAVEFVREHLKEFSASEITIVSDSEYSIKSITEWIYTWEKDPVKHADKKNKDLITAARDIVVGLKRTHVVKFQHMNSHQKEPADADSTEWFMWKCNDIVDGLCNKSLGRK